MMKFFGVLIIFVLLSTPTTAMNVECNFEYYTYAVSTSTYYCDVNNDLNILSPQDAIINSISGDHDSGKSNSDVAGFYATGKGIQYFPRGLEQIFSSKIRLVLIMHGRIKEVHQTDLKPLTQLEVLYLDENDIEVLEEDLFKFNPKLKLLTFGGNKIRKIHPNVFDHLSELNWFHLNANPCIDMYASENAVAIQEVIKEAKIKCSG